MNGQYFGERQYHPSEIIEGTSPDVNLDPLADKVPVDATQVHETPMGGTIAAVGPMDETLAKETLPNETPVQDTLGKTAVADIPTDEQPFTAQTPYYSTPSQAVPMGGTIAPFGSMNGPLADEKVPLYETPVQEIPMEENIAEVVPVEKTIDPEVPMGETLTHNTPVAATAIASTPLINQEDAEHFRTRWNEIQGTFVDEPRIAVQQADALVSEVVEHITQMFAKEHSSLEVQWKQGNDVSTEDLRKALQHYRSFFKRLVI